MNAHTDIATMSYDEVRAAFTPERNFLFDMEGQLYEMEAHSTTLETLLLDVINEMRTHDRGRAAAIDYAATTLRQEIHDLAHRYDELRTRTRQEADQAPAA